MLWSNCLDLDGALKGLGLLCGLGVGLSAHDATTPVTLGLLVLLHVALLDGLDELGKLRLVLGADLGDGDDSGGLDRTVSKRRNKYVIWRELTFLWTTVPRRALPLMMA